MEDIALKMKREVVTDPISVKDLKTDLKKNISLIRKLGVSKLFVLFGFSWGRHIYDGEWKEIEVSVDEMQKMINDAEKKEYGKLGDDNLYITIPEFIARLHYSYETDIHLSYSEKNQFVDIVLKRWSSNGWFFGKEKKVL
ncbi:MAG: hypothetical protein JW882_16405 [Deltaproteobacteria bacterium]|nr:hypothetical protein [Deltaproteobacteria bacterium]